MLTLQAMAERSRKNGELVKAEHYLRNALCFPENLGEGRLEGSKDNDLYYALGTVLREQGRNEEADCCLTLATLGTTEPVSVMYYNDQPADRILYQGLAYLTLGNRAEANKRFYRLLDYGEQHLNDEVHIDYFAVSLPIFSFLTTTIPAEIVPIAAISWRWHITVLVTEIKRFISCRRPKRSNPHT